MAGCAAAWWLEHEGWQIVLVDKELEPYPSSSLLQLDPSAVDALRQMGGGAILDEVTFAAPQVSMRWGGRKVREFEMDTGSEWRLARRAELLSRLFAHLPATVDSRLGVPLEALEHRSDDVVAHFGDGSSEAFDIVVGADGVHSTARQLALASDAQSVYRNGRTHVWINADVPLPDGRAVIASHEGVLLQIYPYLDTDQTSILAVLPVAGSNAPDPRPLVERVCDAIEGLGPDMDTVAAAARTSDDVKLTRFSQVRTPRWFTRRVVLLGDAAHCIDPVSGMGAHASLPGAKVLAESLRDTEDVTVAFARYETEIRPFARTAQTLTARTVEYSTATQRGHRIAALSGAVGDLLQTIAPMLTRFYARRQAARQE